LRHEIGLDANGVFIPDQKPNQMSPNKQYTKIFGQDGYMEIDPSRKEEQKNRIKNRNQWIKSEQNGFTDERKTRPDYRPELDPENA
jgi:hypothetical protein